MEPFLVHVTFILGWWYKLTTLGRSACIYIYICNPPTMYPALGPAVLKIPTEMAIFGHLKT